MASAYSSPSPPSCWPCRGLQRAMLESLVSSAAGQHPWKVLITDPSAAFLFNSLFTPSQLRALDVTMHLPLVVTSSCSQPHNHDERQWPVRKQVPEEAQQRLGAATLGLQDAPAVYFMRPSKENLNYLARDITCRKYAAYFVHFLEPLPDPSVDPSTLQSFTQDLISASQVIPISRFWDLYSDFIAIENDLILSGLPTSFVSNISHSWMLTTHTPERRFQPIEPYFHQLYNNNNPTSFSHQNSIIINRVVSSLFSVLVTLDVIPVIRAQPGSVAEMIAIRLDHRIREHLEQTAHNARQTQIGRTRHNLFQADLVPQEGGGGGIQQGGPRIQRFQNHNSLERPVLIIMDRDFDLPIMLQHPWTYQALAHDVLDYNPFFNHVKIIPSNSAAQSKDNSSVYDLNYDNTLDNNSILDDPIHNSFRKDDPFWTDTKCLPFPKVAEAIELALDKYKSDVYDINEKSKRLGQAQLIQGHSTISQWGNNGSNNKSNNATSTNDNSLANALASLPALTHTKKIVDMHTNIASSILDRIKSRSLDTYYQIEDDLRFQPSSYVHASHLLSKAGGHITGASKSNPFSSTIQQVLQCLGNEHPGTIIDKIRLVLIFTLCTPKNVSNEIDTVHQKCLSLIGDVQQRDSIHSLLRYVRGIRDPHIHTASKVTSITATHKQVTQNPASGTSAGYFSSMVDYGVKGLNQVANNLNKVILNRELACKTATVIHGIMTNKTSSEENQTFAYFDPKHVRRPDVAENVKLRTYNEAIVFMVGGGNYIEYQNIKDHCGKDGRTVIYSSTHLPTSEQFLKELSEVGQVQAV